IADNWSVVVHCHGDFIADNIIVVGETFGVVDFAYSGTGFADQDSVVLTEHLKWLIGWLPAGRRVLKVLLTSFHSGYGSAPLWRHESAAASLIRLRYLSHLIASRHDLFESASRTRVIQRYAYLCTLVGFKRWIRRWYG